MTNLNKKVKVNLPKVKLLKHEAHFSLGSLLVFGLVFAAIGGYLLYRSFAAAPLVATLEAEQMSLPTGGSVISDSLASGGKAIKLTANGTASGSVSLPSPVSSLTVMARGDQCSGAPAMSVSLDGNSLLSNTAVSATSWTAYSVTPNASLASGSHTLSIGASNLGASITYKGNSGKVRGSCSRNLYIDVTNFYGPTVVTPPPTVSLSASPTSVAAGQSSALTWGSTNATACTASGAWSGSEPTSGSTSTGALNTSSTYSLTCTGSGGTATTSTTVMVTSSTGATDPSTLHSSLGFNTLQPTSDDFNGSLGTKPDSTRWGAKTFSATNGSVVYWNGLNNCQLDGNGNLDIFAERGSNGTNWNSCWISGRLSYTGPHYIEARAKVASGAGPWSGPVWEWDAPYGSQGIENDVNEQLAKEPMVYHTTLHNSGTQSSKANTTSVVLGNDFHTYGAAIYSDHTNYYFDGTKIQTITPSELGGKWGFDTTAMVANIDLDMGGWGGTVSSTQPSPTHMYVDYLRVYTK